MEFFTGAMAAWHGIEQGDRIGVFGICKDLVDGSRLDDFSGVHNGDARADGTDDSHIVRNEKQRCFCGAHVSHQLQNLCLHGDIESGRRFIGDDKRWVCHQHRCDHDALLHSAGELERILAKASIGIGDSAAGEPIGCHSKTFGAGYLFVQAKRFQHLIADPVKRRESRHRILKNHSDGGAPYFPQFSERERAKIATIQQDFAGNAAGRRRRHEPQNAHGGHRFSASGFTDDGERVAGVQGQ